MTINYGEIAAFPKRALARRSAGALHIKRVHRRNRTCCTVAAAAPATKRSTMLLRAAQRALRSGARRKSTVVMMRHGESTWNLENKFTGM